MTSLLAGCLLIIAGGVWSFTATTPGFVSAAGIVLGLGIALTLLAGLSLRWNGRRFVADTPAARAGAPGEAAPERASIAS